MSYSDFSRDDYVEKFGPIAGISYDVNSLVNDLTRAGYGSGPTTNFLQHSLNKYMDHSDMHEQFAIRAYQEGRHDEVRSHLDEMRHALRSAHQVVHYQKGKDNPITQAFGEHMRKIDDAINTYQWESQMDE